MLIVLFFTTHRSTHWKQTCIPCPPLPHTQAYALEADLLPSPPPHRPTHWKQTVFYLEEQLTISAGETLEGVLTCTPNSKNPRDLDISIDYKFEGKDSQCEFTQEYRMR